MAKKSPLLIGAHMSISGGAHNAILAADAVDATALQIFTKNNNQWKSKPITEGDLKKYEDARAKSGVIAYVGHVGYLINLASPKPDIYRKSLESLEDETRRASLYGLADLVLHPGAHLGEGIESGIEKIANSLNRVIGKTPDIDTRFALETTAGQGTNIGFKFEHLADIIDRVESKERMSVCLDTCHVFAAGYELRDKKSWNATFRDFDTCVGLDKLKVIHVNDSLKALGSRVDRHSHLGDGELGFEPFRFLMKDRRLKKVPKILETPKGDDPVASDTRNLNILREFAGS